MPYMGSKIIPTRCCSMCLPRIRRLISLRFMTKDKPPRMQSETASMLHRLRVFLDLVRFEHTIFALPFAYIGMVLAAKGLPTLWEFIWVTVAMAAARTLAFAVNRLADRAYDARNPRTKNRPTVTGKISTQTVTLYAGVSLII